MIQQILDDYCSSCGLCEAAFGTQLTKDSKGYLHPDLKNMSDDNIQSLSKICPSTSNYDKDLNGKLWGTYHNVYLGNSKNRNVQYEASSGGVLTSIASFLLDFNKVDGVIHTAVKEDSFYETETVLSRTSSEVRKRCGSRYAISSPLLTIDEYLYNSEKYCFIGKPCDVVALRNYLKIFPEYEQKFPYIFSFFCAGLPSNNAQNKLVETMGFSKSEVKQLRYRGNGWPGYATAKAFNGAEKKIDYNSSWGNILGRDIMKICRFCIDGIGELADISCGDAWYVNLDGTPDFSEHDGRNVIFARNKKGSQLIKEAYELGYLEIKKYENIDELNKSQYHQYSRRATMLGQVIGMNIMIRPTPIYSKNLLLKYAIEGKQFLGNMQRIKGIIGRALQGKI